MSKEARLLKNTAIIAVGNIFTKCISFFMLPLYTSLLSTTEYGMVDLITTIVSLGTCLLSLQLEQGIFRHLIDVRDDEKRQKIYISSGLKLVSIVNLIITFISFFALTLVHYKYTEYLILNVLSAVYMAIVLQIARGLGDNFAYSLGSCVNGSLTVLLNVLFIAGFHWKVEGMLLATLIATVTSSIVVSLKCHLRRYISFKTLDKEASIELLKYSIPLIPNNICWWIVNVSDRIIINLFLNTAANGIYSVACKFPSTFSMVTNIFYTAWTESATENAKEVDSEGYYEHIINKVVRFYSAVCISIIAIMPLAFDILVKKDFKNAYVYIPILLIGALFHSIADLYCSLYIAFKMTRKIFKTTIASAVVNVLINIIFVKSIKIYAAAISTMMAYMIITIYMHTDITRTVRIKYKTSYLMQELTIFFAVLLVYYLRNYWIQLAIVPPIAIISLLQNKDIVMLVINKIFKKRK